MFAVKRLRNPSIIGMPGTVMVRVQYCGVNDGFWIRRATSVIFFTETGRKMAENSPRKEA